METIKLKVKDISEKVTTKGFSKGTPYKKVTVKVLEEYWIKQLDKETAFCMFNQELNFKKGDFINLTSFKLIKGDDFKIITKVRSWVIETANVLKG